MADTNGKQNPQNGQGQNGQPKPGLSWSQPQNNFNNPKPVVPEQARTTQPAAPKHNGNNSPKRIISLIVACIVIIGLIVWALVAARKSEAPTSSTTATSTVSTTATKSDANQSVVSAGSDALTIPSPQDAGLQVAVSNVVVTNPTWVVVYENNNGEPGNALGAGLFVDGRDSGVVYLLRGTLPGQSYFVGESRDDGDHIYSMDRDPAIRDAQGNPVMVQFKTK